MANILKYGDAWGWAYYFVHQEQLKYSKHNISYHAHRNPNPVSLDNIDLLYIHSPDINKFASDQLPLIAKEKGIPVLASYGGLVQNTYKYADIIGSISPQTYKLAQKNYPQYPVIFLPESVDTNFFYPKTDYKQFRVGWVGRKCEIKRHHLLDQLKYPVLKQCDWGKEYFKDNRTLEPVRDFLHNIDCLVLLSKSECMPRVILEAMACGLPVISTNVGSLEMMISKEWLVPSYVEPDENFFYPTKYLKNERKLVHAINEKLNILANSQITRALVGQRNRIQVVNYFSWRNTSNLWDNVFDAIINKDIDKASKMCYIYIKRWESLFE